MAPERTTLQSVTKNLKHEAPKFVYNIKISYILAIIDTASMLFDSLLEYKAKLHFLMSEQFTEKLLIATWKWFQILVTANERII